MYENKEELEKVILFAVDLDNGENVEANLDELEELVATAGAETLGRMIQNKDSVEKATYLGSGKVEELRDMVERLGATGVVCDEESGAGVRYKGHGPDDGDLGYLRKTCNNTGG